MKIGILTLPFTWNYGGILQAFALQKVLINSGHEVVIISRRQNRNSVLIRSIVWGKWSLIKALRVFRVFRFVPLVATEVFKKRYFPNITHNIFSNKSMRRIADQYLFDAFIVGSDQVWNHGSPPHLFNYFFDFTEKMDVVRLAYAASFGREGWHYSEKETLVCSKLVKEFDGISVREKSGVDLCKKYLGVYAHHHLDPTMLLAKEDYINIISDSKVSESNGRLLSYILDQSEENRKIVHKVKDILSMEPFAVEQNKKKLIKNALKGSYPSVAQWLKSFYDAEFVITDSFHGTIFSIIFNKPFISIGNRKRGLARFQSLLSDLGLMDRLVDSLSGVSPAMIKEDINWKYVNNLISEKQEISLEYFQNNLK